MSLSMLGFIGPVFGTGVITIRSVNGAFVNGAWIDDAPPTETQHYATKQVANSDEFPDLGDAGERNIDMARFFINDGSQHQTGSEIIDQYGKTYRIVDADCRPERNYCKLIGASFNG